MVSIGADRVWLSNRVQGFARTVPPSGPAAAPGSPVSPETGRGDLQGHSLREVLEVVHRVRVAEVDADESVPDGGLVLQ